MSEHYRKWVKNFLGALSLAAGLICAQTAAQAQQATATPPPENPNAATTQDTEPQDGTRDIFSEDLMNNRPKPRQNNNYDAGISGGGASASYSNKNRPAAPVRRPKYARVSKPVPRPQTSATAGNPPRNDNRRNNSSGAPGNNANTNTTTASNNPAVESSQPKLAEIGVTVWQMRPVSKTDKPGPRVDVYPQGTGGAVETWVPVRADLSRTFKPDELVRISLESPRKGYLYVINREIMTGCQYGAPTMIFPSTRINGGDNLVAPGRLVNIPALDDTVAYFRLKPGSPNQEGELITVLITPQPLPNIEAGRRALKLENELFARWEKDWSVPFEQSEQEGTAGKVLTENEAQAGSAAADGANGTRELTQDDPAPQALYRMFAKPSNPLMFSFSLYYGKDANRCVNYSGATAAQ